MRRVLVSAAVIFGPALIIAIVLPPYYDDEGEGFGLLFVAWLAVLAIIIGVVLVVAYFTMAWARGRLRQRRSISN
jgi:heme/copper-type cytochrome/quinol oxidase subunit 2